MKNLFVACSLALATIPAFAADVITINGAYRQSTEITDSASVGNMVLSGTQNTAEQNIASNRGNVTLNSNGSQEVTIRGASIVNQVEGSQSTAEQSLAANQGDVRLSGQTSQSVTVTWGSTVFNGAAGTGVRAVQAISTNSSTCVSCR